MNFTSAKKNREKIQSKKIFLSILKETKHNHTSIIFHDYEGCVLKFVDV